MLKRTPLFAAHHKLGGRLIEFEGWEMPVHYTSVMDEHLAVRQAAGVFDISHMGEVLASGTGALDFLNASLTNDLSTLPAGQGQYTLMCRDDGGVIDDLYAYRLAAHEFMLIVNASRIEAGVSWLEHRLSQWPRRDEVVLKNASADFGAVAIQGPGVAGFIDRCVAGRAASGTAVNKPSDLRKNQIAGFEFSGETLYLARTGYTGEDGFEAVVSSAKIESIWNRILELGASSGLKPAGLGARDTLRTEMCYPLYGHELDEGTTPLEAGLGYFVALQKSDFAGRAALVAQKARGPSRRCVAFVMTPKSPPPRPHYPIWPVDAQEGQPLGEVSSGTQSPTLGVGIGLGFVPATHAKPGSSLDIEIRGRRHSAVIVSKPIYKKPIPAAS